MHQILSKPSELRYVLSEDSVLKRTLSSSVEEAKCFVCGKGILDGYSITVKNLKNTNVMFCNRHFPK